MNEVSDQKENMPPVEWDRAMTEFEGDREFIIHLLESFSQTFETSAETLTSHFGDRSGVLRRNVHKLKGTAGNLYAFKLYNLAENWEKAILKNRKTDDNKRLEEIRLEVDRIRDFLKKIQSEP